VIKELKEINERYQVMLAEDHKIDEEVEKMKKTEEYE
jgi:hypothetical protein